MENRKYLIKTKPMKVDIIDEIKKTSDEQDILDALEDGGRAGHCLGQGTARKHPEFLKTTSRMITERIGNDIKDAMKSGDKTRLMALRDIKTKLTIEATKEGGGEVSDASAVSIIGKLIKQRQEAAAIYEQQGRPDLAEEELAQMKTLETYMPSQMSEDEAKALIVSVIASTGATGPRDMGKVMAAAKSEIAGRFDGAAFSKLVKESLS
jgi:uncharacterized protein